MELEIQTVTGRPEGPPALQRLEERLWVLQAQAGDHEAFVRLMERHERPVLYYLRRFIARPEAALDAHQDLWLDVFRGLPGLRSPGAFRVWLYRLAHARAARSIRRAISHEEFSDPLDEVHAEAAEEPSSETDVEAVHMALDRLPPHQREALTLHYLRDLTVEEIAEATGCPLGTIKSRLHHARTAMRRILERNRHERSQRLP